MAAGMRVEKMKMWKINKFERECGVGRKVEGCQIHSGVWLRLELKEAEKRTSEESSVQAEDSAHPRKMLCVLQDNVLFLCF